MENKILYGKADLLRWSDQLETRYPEIAKAIRIIADGMAHDDVIQVLDVGGMRVTNLCHGEEE